jgi:cytochrome c oxidase cbb3-type subunit 3
MNAYALWSISQEWVDLFISLGKPTNVLALITFFVGLFTALAVMRTLETLKLKLGIAPEPKKAPWYSRKKVLESLTDSVPLEREGDVMLNHNYDGIRELDNNLPPWWLYGFYLTILSGMVYLFYYHVMPNTPLQADEFTADMAIIEKTKQDFLAGEANNVDENTVVALADARALADGKKTYDAKCASCHLADGGGSVGPNLTDAYWIHGGNIKNLFTTIKYGVLDKGMISWKESLSPVQMQNVASYILNLQGTKPATPKAPQGTLYNPAAEAAAVGTPADTSAVQP